MTARRRPRRGGMPTDDGDRGSRRTWPSPRAARRPRPRRLRVPGAGHRRGAGVAQRSPGATRRAGPPPTWWPPWPWPQASPWPPPEPGRGPGPCSSLPAWCWAADGCRSWLRRRLVVVASPVLRPPPRQWQGGAGRGPRHPGPTAPAHEQLGGDAGQQGQCRIVALASGPVVASAWTRCGAAARRRARWAVAIGLGFVLLAAVGLGVAALSARSGMQRGLHTPNAVWTRPNPAIRSVPPTSSISPPPASSRPVTAWAHRGRGRPAWCRCWGLRRGRDAGR